MPKPTVLSEPDHVDEPQKVQEYWSLVNRVAATHQPVIVRRGGADVVAVITVEHLELLRELLALHEADRCPGGLGTGDTGIAVSPALV
jgi:prevent-host-death family protein